jgi:catechol 2,3-dioxygenase-like lactoylglutathione lyase family enzyme
MSNEFPSNEMELTYILVVRDIDKSKSFYLDILGAELYREYGGTSCVMKFMGCWLLIVTGGGPTKDKPDVTFEAQKNSQIVDPSSRLGI